MGATAGGVSPAVVGSFVPWQLADIANDYGTAIELFDGTETNGTFDLPFTPVYFDPHRLVVADASANGIYMIRVATSVWTGTAHTYANMAEAVAAGRYSMSEITLDDVNKLPSSSVPMQTGRAPIGSIVWAQVKSTVSGATINIRVGIHGYEE